MCSTSFDISTPLFLSNLPKPRFADFVNDRVPPCRLSIFEPPPVLWSRTAPLQLIEFYLIPTRLGGALVGSQKP